MKRTFLLFSKNVINATNFNNYFDGFDVFIISFSLCLSAIILIEPLLNKCMN